MKKVLLDTNVLVYAFNVSSPKHKLARELVTGGGWVVAQQNLLEFLRVVTHPVYAKKVGSGLGMEFVERLVEGVEVIYPTDLTWEVFRFLEQKYKRVKGNLVFDTYLVATMLSWGVRKIVTDNEKDLGMFEEVEVVGLGR